MMVQGETLLQGEVLLDYRITDDRLGEGSPKVKFARNIEAIKLLKLIEGENRLATKEEQEVLAQYVGWGGLPQAFDQRDAGPDSLRGWEKEQVLLKSLLTDKEYAAARASTLNAHYTSPTVIKAIYQAIENLGFRKGTVLEPACGIGNFFGLLPESMKESELIGVELDSITGRIAKQLYQTAKICVQGYEEAWIPEGSVDLAIGNVPFGSYKVLDKRYDRYNFLIHDYFFARTISAVRPGGIIAFITSKGTMDKQSPEVRQYIAQCADLLGAIRLPNTAFKANAGTEVTTDILFLQRRDSINPLEPDWVHLGLTADGIPVNSYFLDNPHMMLGTMAWDDRMYGNKQDTSCIPFPGRDLAEQLQEAISHIHGSIPDWEDVLVARRKRIEELDILPADPTVRNYSFTVVDGLVYYRVNESMTRVDKNPTVLSRIKGMIELRDQVRELLDMQLHDYPDEDIRDAQRKLGEAYDAFTKKHGLINSQANAQAFDEDDGYYLLCSLEVLDDERKKLLQKAEIFDKRTVRRHTPATHVDTPTEALAVSLSEKARVDIPYMSGLTGITPEAIVEELKGVIFRDVGKYLDNESEKVFSNPSKFVRDRYIKENAERIKSLTTANPFDNWITADEYLSGDVRKKLLTAERFQEITGLYPENVQALLEVQPKDLEASEIDVRLGAVWIPTDVVKSFMFELLDTPGYIQWRMKAHYSPHTAEWNIENKGADRYGNVKANEVYGTRRVNAYEIIEDTLNLRDVRVYDTIEVENGKKQSILNKAETMIAQQKQAQIKEAFRDWIWKDGNRRKELTRLYNDKYNCIRPREYDGSRLIFPGMSPEIALKPHQVNAIARILYGGNTLLAHVVGAGKTFEMIAAGMEARRLGLTNKNLYAVPNHLTVQWASEFLRLYPNANILVATERDFETQNRKRFCSRIAAGDYDAIIMGHSQFEKVSLSLGRQKDMIRSQIDEIVDGIEEVKRNHGERVTIKQLERARKGLEARLAKLNDISRDAVVTFEELGVDRLFIDEADSFKNLFLYTKMRNVAGIAQTDAKKSADMFLKCRFMDETTGGKGIVFATGTPVSNSMTEMYTMQRYLQYAELEARGLNHFDAWASTFGETQTAIELAPEGTGYRAKTRFSRFYNLPELMAMFREVADIQTADMLNLPVPRIKGGAVQNVAIKPSSFQKEMVKGLSERADKVRNRTVKPEEDNMLKITTDGRALALDQRLMNLVLPDDETSKVNALTENAVRIWKEGETKKLTQLVFCDLSTPRDDGGFNIYSDIKKKLVERGIPESEIAFIHDAKNEKQKDALFAKVRKGTVRILIGSTAKMGAGTNVQDRLVALHHLDVPWRPRDLEQREGRILRQGNTNSEVEIFRYVTESTFDAYSYQLVEQKQRFIAQIMTSKSPVRSVDDIDEVALSYAEVKALAAGSPLIKEKMDLDVEVTRLKLLKAAHKSQQYRLEDLLNHFYPIQIKAVQEHIAGLETDISRRDQHTPAGYAEKRENFMMEIQGRMFDKKDLAGAAILEACKLVKPDAGEGLRIGHYRGFELLLSFSSLSREFRLDLKGMAIHQVNLGADQLGNITRIDHQLEGIEERLTRCRAEVESLEQQAENAKAEVKKPFQYEDELQGKMERLAELDSLLRLDERDQPVVVEEKEVTEEEQKGKDISLQR